MFRLVGAEGRPALRSPAGQLPGQHGAEEGKAADGGQRRAEPVDVGNTAEQGSKHSAEAPGEAHQQRGYCAAMLRDPGLRQAPIFRHRIDCGFAAFADDARRFNRDLVSV